MVVAQKKLLLAVTTLAAGLLVHCRRRLLNLTQQRQQQRRYRTPYEYDHFKWDLDSWGANKPRKVLHWSRFTIPEIRRIIPLLRLHEVKWSHRVCPSEETAFCVILARLAFPNRWPAIQDIFGRSATWLSIVWADVILHLSRTFGSLLGCYPLLNYERLKVYADGTFFTGGMEDIWGFVDGTFRAFCKPSASDEAQQAAYSGHKKLHGQNWQAIVTPDGLIVSLVGTFFGPANDWTMWRLSGCKEEIRRVMEGHKMLWVYGDPAYRLSYVSLWGQIEGKRCR